MPMMTGMERAETLGKLRDQSPRLPVDFMQSEKALPGEIILSLVDHDPLTRPTSADLLASDRIPEEVEGDKWLATFFAMHTRIHTGKSS